jgi:hypothetical protein
MGVVMVSSRLRRIVELEWALVTRNPHTTLHIILSATPNQTQKTPIECTTAISLLPSPCRDHRPQTSMRKCSKRHDPMLSKTAIAHQQKLDRESRVAKAKTKAAPKKEATPRANRNLPWNRPLFYGLPTRNMRAWLKREKWIRVNRVQSTAK